MWKDGKRIGKDLRRNNIIFTFCIKKSNRIFAGFSGNWKLFKCYGNKIWGISENQGEQLLLEG